MSHKGYGFKGEYFVDEPNNNFLWNTTPKRKGIFNWRYRFKSDKMKYYEGPINDEFILSAGDVIVTMTDLSKQADTLLDTQPKSQVTQKTRTYTINDLGLSR